MTEQDKPVESPCVSICYLDESNVCAGCYRNSDEITEWTRYSNDEKRAVLALSNQRRKDSGFSF